ncbi:MAG: Crp/Fnr family transcriptional regulator [Ardenticatenaceae bacterium]|nr:Crp/Fnr family transcriptional regulator [Ardenticatenaceae bacterium]
MGDPTIAELLQKNPWFRVLELPLFQKLVDIATVKDWEEGATIFREGDRDDNLYLILEGQVALEVYVQGHGRITILTIGQSEIFGWSAVLPVEGTRTASARAMRSTQAIAFDSSALRQACDEDHDLGYQVYRRLTNVVAGRLSATRLQLLDMYAHKRG